MSEDKDKAPERVFLRACHPANPNRNCSWDVDKDREGSVAYVPESALATVRREAREDVWTTVLKIANAHLDSPGFGYILRQKLIEAAALERAADSREGEDDGLG